MYNLEHIINPLSLSGLVFVIVGIIMYLFPPKNINMLYGYKTNKSMKNQDTWDFAQIYAAKKMSITGFVMLLLSVNFIVFNFSDNQVLVIGLIGVLFSVVYLIIKTENAIYNKFKK